MKTLHKQLLALACAATLGTGAVLHAQNNYPAPAKTPEEAGALFYQLLSTGTLTDGQSSGAGFDSSRAAMSLGSVSRAQMQAMTGRGRNAVEQLFALLSQEKTAIPFDGHIAKVEGEQILVEVTPAATPRNRPVVVIAEDGGYRVDLKATYARWNNLSGTGLDESWYDYTGIVSPALAGNGPFARAQCLSQMKQQMLGMMQYTQDYDEKYPLARAWTDVLQPYIRSEQMFHCPSLTKEGQGYAYNSKFSRASMSSVRAPSLTITIYETSNLARNVFAPFNGRAYRHQLAGRDGMNIAFADGHVKWFERGKEALPPITSNP